MNYFLTKRLYLIPIAMTVVLTAACTTTPMHPEGYSLVRNKLGQLQADAELARRAPLEISEAEKAVRLAEKSQKDKQLDKHYVLMANYKVDNARAIAQSRLLVDQRKGLSEERETARLDSRTREVDVARNQAAIAENETAIAESEAETARNASANAQKKNLDLERQISDLNAKVNDQGLVVTLGDLLFASGGSELKGGVANNLDKLVTFLKTYPDRNVIIEGHTDSMGSEEFNLGLSQHRAESVKNYLVGKGIDNSRLTISTKGEAVPVASNATAVGRQMNRRVEVVILDSLTSR